VSPRPRVNRADLRALRSLPMTPLALLVLALAPQEPAVAPSVLWRDVRATGTSSIDLVFLPDGFRAEERDAFERSVRTAVERLETLEASFVRSARERWNLHVGFVPSREACPSRAGALARDTAFRTHLEPDEEGGLFASDDAAIEGAARALAPGRDAVVVIVRSAGRVGFATGDLPREGARVRLPEGFEDAILHELGHSLFALGDEYVGRRRPLPTVENAVVPFYPNLTLDRSGARFATLGLTSSPLEEGALDFRTGVFRSAAPCVMRDLEATRFCPPCAAVIAAGLPEAPPPPPEPPRLVAPRGEGEPWAVELTSAPREAHVLRRLAVLFRLDAATDDATLRTRFAAAEARVSRKTRYMESPWLGDGSLADEAVFSMEPQITRRELGVLAPGQYVLALAQANLLETSSLVLVRFEVAPSAAPR